MPNHANKASLPGTVKSLRRLLSVTAAVGCCTLAPVAAAQDFGKIFTTPDEREYLDYLRQDFVTRRQMATFNIQEDVIPEIPQQPETDAEPGGLTAAGRARPHACLGIQVVPVGTLGD